MSEKAKNYITGLIAQTITHEEWEIVVRFGLQTLLENPVMLIEIVFEEAKSELARRAQPRDEPGNVLVEVVKILTDLNLKIVSLPAPETVPALPETQEDLQLT